MNLPKLVRLSYSSSDYSCLNWEPHVHICILSAQAFYLDGPFKASTFLLWFLLYICSDRAGELQDHISASMGSQIFALDEPFKDSCGVSYAICSDMTPGPYNSDLGTQIHELDGPIKSISFLLTVFLTTFAQTELRAPCPYISILTIQTFCSNKPFKTTSSFYGSSYYICSDTAWERCIHQHV